MVHFIWPLLKKGILVPVLDGVPVISPEYSYIKCKHSIATSAGFALFYFGRKANQPVSGNYLSGIVKAFVEDHAHK